eukprot:5628512-Pleurochrysis_carterae.AAC.6
MRTHARHTHTCTLAFLVHVHTHACPHSRASARRRQVGGRRGRGAALGVSSGEASSDADLGASSKYSDGDVLKTGMEKATMGTAHGKR